LAPRRFMDRGESRRGGNVMYVCIIVPSLIQGVGESYFLFGNISWSSSVRRCWELVGFANGGLGTTEIIEGSYTHRRSTTMNPSVFPIGERDGDPSYVT
jgi:hypothetical protein